MAAKSLRGLALDGGFETLVPAGLGAGVGMHQSFHSIRDQRGITQRSLVPGAAPLEFQLKVSFVGRMHSVRGHGHIPPTRHTAGLAIEAYDPISPPDTTSSGADRQ